MTQPDSQPGVTGPLSDPTEQISRSVMARLFSSVLDTPAEAPGSRNASNRAPSAPASPLPAEPERQSNTSQPADRQPQTKKAESVKGFRNHAELLKFASLLINDVEDMLKA